MFRTLLPAAFAACLVAATPALSETEKERGVRCEAQAGIVAQAVDLRLDKKRERRARKLLLKNDALKAGFYAEDEALLKQHVDLLVNWVYQLPEAQLGEDASTAFQIACNQFQS